MTATEAPPETNAQHQRVCWVEQIVRNDTSITLRGVDKDSVAFQHLVQSIKAPRVDETGRTTCDHGLILPIAVRPIEGRPGKYALIDGLQRFTAWQEAFGTSKPIPVVIQEATDDQVLEMQVEANALKTDTKIADYANQILRILDHHPERSLAEQAERLHVEEAWLKSVLSLTKLPVAIKEAVNEKKIPVSVGYVLARFTEGGVNKNPERKDFWEEKQSEWLDHYYKVKDEAQGLQRWMGDCATALKQIKKDLKDNKDPSQAGQDVAPSFTMRKKTELEIELTRVSDDLDSNPFNFDAFSSSANDPTKKALNFAFQKGYLACLQYVGQVDPDTLSARKAAMDAKQAERKEVQEQKKAGKKSETLARSKGLFDLFGKK